MPAPGGSLPGLDRHSNAAIRHILLLPTGLADGLGQEVACPTALTHQADSPQKLGPPLLRLDIGELGG